MHLLEAGKSIEAKNCFEKIKSEFPNDYRGYWGMAFYYLFATPTTHGIISSQSEYKTALLLADSDTRSELENIYTPYLQNAQANNRALVKNQEPQINRQKEAEERVRKAQEKIRNAPEIAAMKASKERQEREKRQQEREKLFKEKKHKMILREGILLLLLCGADFFLWSKAISDDSFLLVCLAFSVSIIILYRIIIAYGNITGLSPLDVP